MVSEGDAAKMKGWSCDGDSGGDNNETYRQRVRGECDL